MFCVLDKWARGDVGVSVVPGCGGIGTCTGRLRVDRFADCCCLTAIFAESNRSVCVPKVAIIGCGTVGYVFVISSLDLGFRESSEVLACESSWSSGKSTSAFVIIKIFLGGDRGTDLDCNIGPTTDVAALVEALYLIPFVFSTVASFLAAISTSNGSS